nr:hypothetical protein [Tanacetum cinerariifolium]
MPPGIKEDDYDSERDMLIFEEFLSNDSLSLPENELFHFDIPSSPRPPAKPPGDDEIERNLGILIVKVVGDISEQTFLSWMFHFSISSLLDQLKYGRNRVKLSGPKQALEIDETDFDPEEESRLIKKLLYDNLSPCPPEEFISENSDAAIESFSPFPISVEDSDSFMEKIDLSSTPDYPMPPGIEEVDYESERDMLIFEELLSNDSLSLPENEKFYFDIPSSSRPPVKPPDDDSGILTIKMVGEISEHDVPMLRLLPTQPNLISNQEKSPYLLSHQGFKASQLHSKSHMMIYEGNTPILDVSFLHSYPL